MTLPEVGVARRLIWSWIFQNVGFASLAEATARAVVEIAACVVLALLGLSLIPIVLGWLVIHTLLWFLIYGGFSRIRVVLGMPAPMPRLQAYVDRLRVQIGRTWMYRVALLRGSVARGEMTTQSDIDVLLVPRATTSAKIRGVLFLWVLRIQSVFARVPLQARQLDREVFVSLNVVGESPVSLVPSRVASGERNRLAEHSFLLVISGTDPVVRALVARDIADTLRTRGFDATCIAGVPLSSGTMLPGPTLNRYLLGLRACLVPVRWRMRLSRLAEPRRAVVLDGYLADLWANLESAGPIPAPLRTLMVGIAPVPDAAVLLEPETAGTMSGSSPSVRPVGPSGHMGYRWYGSLLGMRFVDPVGEPREIARQIVSGLGAQLGLP